MTSPWEFWSPVELAAITGAPEANIRQSWPAIHGALTARGAGDRPVQVGAIATVAVESGAFLPVAEAWWLAEDARNRYLTTHYEGRADLGNTQSGDGVRYAGRGFVQITGRSNYTTYGRLLGVDLVGNPDLALRPEVAAHVLAVYFLEHRIRWEPAPAPLMSCVDLSRAGDWRGVRVAVNGGENGLTRFLEVVAALQKEAPMPAPPLPFNPDAPCDLQPDDWSCSIQSVQWLLRSIGRNPDGNNPVADPWLRSQLVPGIVSPDVGLRDASGQQMAGWVTQTYGAEMGFTAQASPVTFDDVAAGAGVNPMMCGGRAYGPGGHWVGIRRVLPDGSLELANPAPGYTGTGPSLDRAEWDARGPWSCIWIDRMSTLEPPKPPDPVPPAIDKAAVLTELRAILARHDEYAARMHRDLEGVIAMVEALS